MKVFLYLFVWWKKPGNEAKLKAKFLKGFHDCAIWSHSVFLGTCFIYSKDLNNSCTKKHVLEHVHLSDIN